MNPFVFFKDKFKVNFLQFDSFYEIHLKFFFHNTVKKLAIVTLEVDDPDVKHVYLYKSYSYDFYYM